MRNLIRMALFCLLTAAGPTTGARAAVTMDSEPNNACSAAQEGGTLASNATASIAGALVTPPTTPDVDFYKFSGVPGGMVRITLRGNGDGTHTLVNPILGVLDSSCFFINYPWAPNPESMILNLPSDGVFVVGVSSDGDFSFNGSGATAGTYAVEVADVEPVRSISGRVVAEGSQTGVGNVIVNLFFCTDVACQSAEYAGQSVTDYTGQYRFDQSFTGWRLRPGNYSLSATELSGAFLPAQTPVFTALAGQDRVVADIGLKPTPVIGSISGRIVDAVTRAPLSGSGAPNAHVSIFGCVEANCSSAAGVIDSTGRFRIERTGDGRGIVAGTTFQVSVGADQYQDKTLFTATIREGEHLDLGDIKINSNPVRFRVLQGCQAIPLTGGTCRYEVEITNGLPSRVKGAAWATISANDLAGFVGYALFQAGAPRDMQLAPATRTRRSTRVAHFEFDIPASVPTYAYICPSFWFGSDPGNAQLLPQGLLSDFGLCVQRTLSGFKPVTAEQVKSLRKAAREHDAKRRSLMLPKH